MIGASIKRASWLKEDEFTVIHNGRNPYQADPDAAASLRSKWNILPGEKVIGMTCQLTKVKHTDHLINTFRNISSKFPEWKLVISGEGPEKSRLEGLVNELGLNKQVIFAGFSIDPLLSAASYDIAISVSKIEGFPNTIVEYFAAGKPVISTDVGGVREIIKDHFNGILIPFADTDALQRSLEELITHPKLREELASEALETLKKSFTEDMMINKLEKFFLDCK